MMKKPKSENVVWLTLMSVAALGAIAFFPPEIKLAVILGWLGAAILTFTDIQPLRWLRNLQSATPIRKDHSGKSQTPAARQASARAKARGNFISNDLQLLDIGLIAINQGARGPVFQRTNSLNSDHKAVRPYIRLRLPSNFYERHARLRFSLKDPTGNEMFIHEQETWLTPGEQDTIPTHQMPISDSQVTDNLGDWKLEVALDGRLIAEHNFRISPTIERRRERLQSDTSTSSRSVSLDELISDE